MRMIRLALAAAAVFLTADLSTRAADLLPADRPIAEVVDHYIDAVLRQESVQPSSPADDATLIRRLTLDLAGRIPTAAESSRSSWRPPTLTNGPGWSTA